MGDQSIKIRSEHHEELINHDDVDNLDVIAIGQGDFHILDKGASYTAKVTHYDHSNKSYRVELNGNSYDIVLQDSYDLLVEKMGLNVISDQKLGDVLAPMPGLVIDVLVNEGDEVTKGDPLLILEAMKMENVLKASGDGVIKSIPISKTDTVDKGQVLIEMEK